MKKIVFGTILYYLNFELTNSLNIPRYYAKASSARVAVIRSSSAFSRVKTTAVASLLLLSKKNEPSFDPFYLESKTFSDENLLFSRPGSAFAMPTVLAVFLGLPAVSSAAGPDWGIFEGKTGSLLHPLVMGSLFLFQVNTAIKGFNWRRQRTMGDEISELKKQIPSLPEGAKTLQEAIEMNMDADGSIYKAALDVEREANALMEERKILASQNNRDSHYNQGAILAFFGTLFAIEGPLNTYARAGKLFPGPHLYAGAGLVVCWAAAAACVPHMQKGNDTARSLHIGANVIGMALFAWQVTSGIPILLKVWELTKWP
jgi:hypothetical protein